MKSEKERVRKRNIDKLAHQGKHKTWFWRRKYSSIKVYITALVVLSLIPETVHADWDSNCPSTCKCTYVSNRKVSKCESANYKSIPATFSAEIQELLLADNLISRVNALEFQTTGLVNLQRLELNNNLISFVDEDAFAGLRIMIELDLRNNAIHHLYDKTFTGMEKLRKLDLSGNQISRLESKQFPPLLHLQILKFNSNVINYVHNLAFINLPNITTIGLTGNALESIQPDSFIRNERLVSLELSNNPWNCDCRMRSLARWMTHSLFKNTNWNCLTPDHLSGKKWQVVRLNEFACDPTVEVHQEIVSLNLHSNSSLDCWAFGDPLPSLDWYSGNALLTNDTKIGEYNAYYTVKKMSNSSLIYSVLQIGVYGDHHPSNYSCVATNPANSVRKTISIVIGTADPLDVIVKSGVSLYVLFGIGITLVILLLILLSLILVCYIQRRRLRKRPIMKLGNSNDNSDILLVGMDSSITSNNKASKLYEKVPQRDIDVTSIGTTSKSSTANGEHSFNKDDERDFQLIHTSENLFKKANNSPFEPIHTFKTSADLENYKFPDLLDSTHTMRSFSPTITPYQNLYETNLHQVKSSSPDSSFRSDVSTISQPPKSKEFNILNRQRTLSGSGLPTTNFSIAPDTLASPLINESESHPIDHLGPRSKADGTSLTDLSKIEDAPIIDSIFLKNYFENIKDIPYIPDDILSDSYLKQLEDIKCQLSNLSLKTDPRYLNSVIENAKKAGKMKHKHGAKVSAKQSSHNNNNDTRTLSLSPNYDSRSSDNSLSPIPSNASTSSPQNKFEETNFSFNTMSPLIHVPASKTPTKSPIPTPTQILSSASLSLDQKNHKAIYQNFPSQCL